MPPVAPGFPKTYNSSTFQSTSHVDLEKISPLPSVYSTPKKVSYLQLLVLVSCAGFTSCLESHGLSKVKVEGIESFWFMSLQCRASRQFGFWLFVHDWIGFLTTITLSLSFKYCLNLVLFNVAAHDVWDENAFTFFLFEEIIGQFATYLPCNFVFFRLLRHNQATLLKIKN